MIRPGAVVMTVVMVGVATGVYFGLNYLPQDLLPGALKRSRSSEQTAAPAPKPAPESVTPEPTPEPAPAGAANELQPATTEGPAVADAAAPPPAAEPAPAEAPAASAPAPAEPATIAEAPVDSEPAAVEPEPEPAPKPRKRRTDVAIAPSANDPPRQPVKAPPPAADAVKPWWPDPSKMPANQLKLQYAGQVQGERAIALLFSGAVNLETLRRNAEVRTSYGERVAGDWQLGNNPRLAVFRGLEPGRYTVILSPPVADQSGYLLGTALQGPVYIQ